MFEGKWGSLGGVAAAAVLGASLPAYAQPLHNLTPFGDGRGASNPPVGHYLASPGRSFVLDRLAIAPEALLKFDDNVEVWVLEPSVGPGGVTYYSNDVGDRMVRVTRLGGVTLYTQREPEGVPVSLQGEAEELLLPAVIPDRTMLQLVPQASEHISGAAQTAVGKEHPVNVTAGAHMTNASAVFFDAITVATKTLEDLARRKDAKPFFSKLDQVLFVVGAKPDAVFNGSVLTITLTPGRGFAGRPSSNRIVKSVLRK